MIPNKAILKWLLIPSPVIYAGIMLTITLPLCVVDGHIAQTVMQVNNSLLTFSSFTIMVLGTIALIIFTPILAARLKRKGESK